MQGREPALQFQFLKKGAMILCSSTLLHLAILSIFAGKLNRAGQVSAPIQLKLVKSRNSAEIAKEPALTTLHTPSKKASRAVKKNRSKGAISQKPHRLQHEQAKRGLADTDKKKFSSHVIIAPRRKTIAPFSLSPMDIEHSGLRVSLEGQEFFLLEALLKVSRKGVVEGVQFSEDVCCELKTKLQTWLKQAEYFPAYDAARGVFVAANLREKLRLRLR